MKAVDWEQAPCFVAGPEPGSRTLRPCAYGLIRDAAGRVAVVRAPDGVFLPGGGLEPGESPEAAVVREALEECGWTVRVGRCVAAAVQLTPSFRKPSSFYEIEILHDAGAALEPGHETLWLAPPDAERTLSHASHAWAVRQLLASLSRSAGAAPRRIVDFHQDDEGHWVADLECGHAQHVRHDPPWQSRPWVLTPEGRSAFVGVTLGCVHCRNTDPPAG